MGSCQSNPEKKNKKKPVKYVKNKVHVIATNKINSIATNKVNSIATHKKKQIPKALKKLVWDTWVWPNVGCTKCLCCKHEEIRQIEFHCGHIISESTGGQTTVDNLRPICAQCNLSMGAMNMNEFKKKYFT